MVGIDDWYQTRAHRGDVQPEYSPDDDIPDPVVFGEAPAHGWSIHRGGQPRHKTRISAPKGPRKLPPAASGGTWESAARKWLTAFPQGTNRECERALKQAGHKKATTRVIERLRRDLPAATPPPPPKAKTSAGDNRAANTRRSTSGNKRRRAAGAVSWQGFAVQWLRTHPDASNRKWREAVEEAGYVGVTNAAISRLRHDAKPGKAKPSRRPIARPTSTPTRTAGVDYCDGCGIAVRDDGLCRC